MFTHELPPTEREKKMLSHIYLATARSVFIGLDSGSESEVKELASWIQLVIDAKEAVETLDRPDFQVSAVSLRGALLVSVFAQDAVLAVFGVAPKTKHRANLWELMVSTHGAHLAARIQTAPLCVTARKDALSNFQGAQAWLDDFERDVAWAWIRRNSDTENI